LPRVEEVGEPRREEKLREEVPRGSQVVLLVEDEEAVLALAQRVLEAHGYTVLAAVSPEDALRLSEQHAGRIDLLLTDVVMPQMSCRRLAERLTLSRPEMKVLYMSGYTDNAVVHHGILEPGIAFLQKPFTPEALARKVREVLDLAPVSS
jgi:two-component system, cell cycle sensor histidine kinase and response regulator CckA